MARPEPIGDDVGFSLICRDCDAGMEIISYDQALSEGWTAIVADPGLAWNYVGLCPACCRAQDERDRPKGSSDQD
jgi:hypothetical protein